MTAASPRAEACHLRFWGWGTGGGLPVLPRGLAAGWMVGAFGPRLAHPSPTGRGMGRALAKPRHQPVPPQGALFFAAQMEGGRNHFPGWALFPALAAVEACRRLAVWRAAGSPCAWASAMILALPGDTAQRGDPVYGRPPPAFEGCGGRAVARHPSSFPLSGCRSAGGTGVTSAAHTGTPWAASARQNKTLQALRVQACLGQCCSAGGGDCVVCLPLTQ